MPEPALIIEVCTDCEQDLEHCHGTAIVHGDGAGDCTEDPGCCLGVEQHLFSVSCSAVECDCGAPLPEAGWRAAHAAAS